MRTDLKYQRQPGHTETDSESISADSRIEIAMNFQRKPSLQAARSCSALLSGALCLAATALPCRALDWKGDPYLALGLGQAEVIDGVEKPTRYSIEARTRSLTAAELTPLAGVGFTESEASLFYAGLNANFWPFDWWAITPGFAAGVFDGGDAVQLGSSIEFRSSIETSVRFPNGIRLGLSFAHVSNGGLSNENPGTETWSVVLLLPFP